MENGVDTEQIEAFREWWRRNGRYVVIGLVIAVIVVGGWQLWGYWQARQASAAAQLYARVIAAEQSNDLQTIAKRAHAVQNQYPDTAYASLAGLALAKAQFMQQNYDKAGEALEYVSHHAPDPGLASIARLRLARIQLQQDKAKEALATLEDSKIAPTFSVSAITLRGKAFVALGRIDDARSAWRAAQAMSAPGSERYSLLAMRLASLPASQGANAVQPVVKATPEQTAAQAQATVGAPAQTTGAAS